MSIFLYKIPTCKSLEPDLLKLPSSKFWIVICIALRPLMKLLCLYVLAVMGHEDAGNQIISFSDANEWKFKIIARSSISMPLMWVLVKLFLIIIYKSLQFQPKLRNYPAILIWIYCYFVISCHAWIKKKTFKNANSYVHDPVICKISVYRVNYEQLSIRDLSNRNGLSLIHNPNRFVSNKFQITAKSKNNSIKKIK